MKILSVFALIGAAAMLTAAAGCGSGSSSESSPAAYSRDIFAMDTYMSVRIYGGGETALDAAEGCIKELESKLSVTIDGSDVSRLDLSGGKPVEVSADTLSIIQKAQDISRTSGGALDITAYPLVKEWGFTTGDYKVPSQERIDQLLRSVDYSRLTLSGSSVTLPADQQIDLGALAKGYTGDKVISTLRENGAEAAIISLGGNVQSFGTKPDGSPWKVAVRDPFSPDRDMCVIETGEKAVITSGNYERCFTADDGKSYWHIIDPTDGYPADNGIVSATVIGDEGLACDGLSTALFVKGTKGAVDMWKADRSYDMILVTDDKRILYTQGIADSFKNLSSMSAEVIAVD